MNRITKSTIAVAAFSLLSFSTLATEQDTPPPTDGDVPVTHGHNHNDDYSFGASIGFGSMVSSQDKFTTADPTISTDNMKMSDLAMSAGKMKMLGSSAMSAGKMKMLGLGLTAVDVNPHLFNRTLTHKSKWYPKPYAW